MIAYDEVSRDWRLSAGAAWVGLVALAFELRMIVYAGGDDSMELRISTPFLVSRNESQHQLDPEGNDPLLGDLMLDLRQKHLLACRVQENGTLTLEFAGHLRIEVPADSDHEAWDLEPDC